MFQGKGKYRNSRNQYKQDRHQNLTVFFNSFIYSFINNHCRNKHIDQHPYDRLSDLCNIACKISVFCCLRPMTCEKCRQIFEYPSTNRAIIWKNDNRYCTCKHTDSSPSFMHLFICSKRTLSCLTSDRDLCCQQRKPKGKCQYHIAQNKHSASTFCCQIRESPDVPQPDCTSRSRQHESDRAGKITPLLFHLFYTPFTVVSPYTPSPAF